jgi:hypothetical protein
MQVILSLAIPEPTYSFGIFNWHQENNTKLDRKKMLTIHAEYHKERTLIAKVFPEKREEED